MSLLNRPIAYSLLGAFILLTVALINGQPFFYPDSSNYVRGPDAAVTTFLGPRFATVWTRTPQQQSERKIASNNSLQEGFIISGRSPFYGGLLYLAEITGGLFASTFVHAVVLSYVLFVVLVTCFGFSALEYLLSAVGLTLFTSAPFFVALLMPDIFAGVAVLVAATLLTFWQKLHFWHRLSFAGILSYAILSHSSIQLIVVVVLGGVLAGLAINDRASLAGKIAPILVIICCIVCGFLGEIAFDRVVVAAFGNPPVRPPFLTARLIDLGPGYEYIKSHCADESFAVCRFQDRLPQLTDIFLWSQVPDKGIFVVTDVPTKRALGNEQYRFALSVLRFDPVGVMVSYIRSGITQLATFGLEEFRICADCGEEILPARYWLRLREATAFQHPQLIYASEWEQRVVMVVSAVYVLVRGIAWFRRDRFVSRDSEMAGNSTGIFFFALIVGVMSNALICGAFSTVHDRYQARLIWLIPLMALIAFASRQENGGARFAAASR